MAQQSNSRILDILRSEKVKIVDGSGNNVSKDRFIGGGKILGLYVSAHWCPPCRGFTPVLAEFYKNHPDRDNNFNIIFISCDRDTKSFKDYFGTMPWLALDFDDKGTQDELKNILAVRGIPQFSVVDGADGSIIVQNARGQVTGNTSGFPWRQ